MKVNIDNLELVEYSLIDDGWYFTTLKETFVCRDTNAIVTVEVKVDPGDDSLTLISDNPNLENIVDKVYEIFMDPNFTETAMKEYVLSKIK